MTATLEPTATEVRPDQPPLPAEAATDVPPAERLGEPSFDDAEPVPSQAGEIDAQVAAERHKLRERIRQSSSLSRGMRDRLSALLEEVPTAASDSQPLIRAADALAILEEAIPPQLRLDATSLAQPEHPAGDAFFTGDMNQMTDDQAERIAREQLSRSAFARS
ncbi:MAG: hypothetical protein IAF94_10845 [Pirellulaceae bacterium]|nr:hypothetical protein [Pirellulaceae bacterium]